jgi:hypothetical protein
MTSPLPPLPGFVLAVSSASVARPGVKLRTHVAEAGDGTDAVGDGFPGLYVEWSGQRVPETVQNGLSVGIWVAGLALVLKVALFGGYQLLRDVNRDVRMTADVEDCVGVDVRFVALP